MLDRRQFLSAAATGAALTLVGAVGADRRPGPDSNELAHPELLAALGPEAVREIGEAYRRLVPAESSRPALETAVRTAHRASRSSHDDPIRADFAANRVIIVRNWMLSHTEARQCALFSLRSA